MDTRQKPADNLVKMQPEAGSRDTSSRTLVWMTDQDGVLTLLNHTASCYFDEDSTPTLSAWTQFIHPDDLERVRQVVHGGRETRSEYQHEYRIINPDGAVRWVTSSGVPRFSDAGEFLGYIGAMIDVTDRYEVISQLEQSEAVHRLLTENSSDLISHHAPEVGTYLYASPSFKRWLGFEPAELVGTSVYDRVHPNDEEVVRSEILRQLTQGGESKLIEFRIRHKDGHYVWMGTNVKLLINPVTHEKIGSVAVSRDITAERQANDELKQREERFRSLISLSSDWYWETDDQGRFTYLPDGTQRPTGLPQQSFLGKTRSSVAYDPNDPGLLEYFAKVAKHEPFKHIRYATIGPTEGAVRYASISGEPVFNDGIFKGYRGTGRDVTAEVEAAERMSQLADENKALIENSLDIIAMLDNEGRVLRINEAVVDILGYEPDEILGIPYTRLLHPEELESIKAVNAKLRAGDCTMHDIENRWIRKDGTIVHLSMAVRWSERKRLMYVTARDVSERHRARDELQKSKARLSSTLESIGDAFFVLDKDWRISYANRNAREFAGVTQGSAVGKIIWEAVPSLLSSPTLPYYRKAMETRENTFFEIYLDYKRAWISVRVYPTDEGLSIYFHDITARREAEEALRKSEHRFKNLFELAGDSIIITDNKMRIQAVNKRACQVFGYTREELLQLTVHDIQSQFDYHKDMLSDLRAGQTRLIRGEKKRKDGTTFPAEVHISRFEEDDKEFFQATVRDLTEREQAQRMIDESEQRFREVIEMTPAGYAFADVQGILRDVNPAFCIMSGYSRDEIIGRSFDNFFPECPCDGSLMTKAARPSFHAVEGRLSHKNGHIIHVLINANIKRDAEGNALSLTAFLTDITKQKQTEIRLEQLANHDTLTGLPNRAFLNAGLQTMLDTVVRGHSVAVMFIDLDRFKEVNDTMGHDPGDILLREVALRLQSAMRPNDLVARLGGDEFIVAAHCSKGMESAETIAQKLLTLIGSPFMITGAEVVVSASIGISMFPEHGKTKDVLFQNADMAMYSAKAAGRSAYRFFDPEMSEAAKIRMTLESSLRHAIDRNEFELNYQPRVDLKTMEVVGMEALIRWNHPQLGRIPPLQFIPLAEESDVINSIGLWVLKEACVQTRRLVNTLGRPLRVSVNMSARQLKSPPLVEQVKNILDETGLPRHLLEIELTETALMEDLEASASMLKKLKALGVSLAVDDFGTGYSGLAYLRRFPLDMLKLDRSFLNQQDGEMSTSEFVKAFVDLAHALNLSVIAEGIETEEILAFLQQSLCDEGQGYLFARPLSLADLEIFLARTTVG